jgi:hypothetical protein
MHDKLKNFQSYLQAKFEFIMHIFTDKEIFFGKNTL